jgi:hypothetical protein
MTSCSLPCGRCNRKTLTPILAQGIAYDLLAQHLDSTETRRSVIVANKGWNHILDQPDQVRFVSRVQEGREREG